MEETDTQYDVFISHASEDKSDVVFPLADLLRSVGVKVWYDGFELEVGDSLSRSIDRGLVHSRYGIVLISPQFLSKDWTEYELRGLVTKEIGKDKVILPIWHNVTREDVAKYSPTLADKFALSTKGEVITSLGQSLVKVIRPDIHQAFQRYLLRRAAQLNQLEKIPLNLIHQGSVRHPTLPQALMARIIVIHALTERWIPMSLKESIDTFRPRGQNQLRHQSLMAARKMKPINELLSLS